MGDSAHPSVRTGPPRLRLLGRSGVGKTVLAAALRRRGIDVDDGAGGGGGVPAPADATAYCFAGGLRGSDRAAIETLADDPLLVIWCRADAAGSWRAADAHTERVAEVLGRPVTAVMALLDAPDVDLAVVRRIAGTDLALPESVLDAAVALGGDADLLHRLGGYGLACAIGALREAPSMPDEELRTRLRELGGVDALLAPLAAAFHGCGERRRARFEDELRALAHADCARRDRAEQELLDLLGRAS
ncbi:hypothetical protein GCM10027289_16410 [Tsukamurella serpentis]